MKKAIFAVLITLLSLPAMGQAPDAKSAFERAEVQLAQKKGQEKQDARTLSIQEVKAEALSEFGRINQMDLQSIVWDQESDVERPCTQCKKRKIEQNGHYFKSTGEPCKVTVNLQLIVYPRSHRVTSLATEIKGVCIGASGRGPLLSVVNKPYWVD